MLCKGKSAKNTFFCAEILDHFQAKKIKNVYHFFLLLFPNDSESLKSLQIVLYEVDAKRRLNGTSKSEQTDGRTTHTQTEKSTYRLNWPRGPIQ